MQHAGIICCYFNSTPQSIPSSRLLSLVFSSSALHSLQKMTVPPWPLPTGTGFGGLDNFPWAIHDLSQRTSTSSSSSPRSAVVSGGSNATHSTSHWSSSFQPGGWAADVGHIMLYVFLFLRRGNHLSHRTNAATLYPVKGMDMAVRVSPLTYL
jgi:hypothetical protein